MVPQRTWGASNADRAADDLATPAPVCIWLTTVNFRAVGESWASAETCTAILFTQICATSDHRMDQQSALQQYSFAFPTMATMGACKGIQERWLQMMTWRQRSGTNPLPPVQTSLDPSSVSSSTS